MAVANDAPTGTVIFLFSDVVGSTRLWAKDPDAMSASLRIHDQIFTDTIGKFDGFIFATAGDSFAAAFARASAAVECASAIQESLGLIEWGSLPELKVRMGLHVGEAEERNGNYFGPAVNQAARLMAVAHGDQCVLTDGVRDAAGIEAMDLGVHTLRDIDHPVHINQLGTMEFPPLWTIGVGIVALPSPRTSLVGRDEAVLEVRRLLAGNRLVTLTGVGGCGKTRLSIEVAYREVSSHHDGVWFVDLSTISDENALVGVFASALQLSVTAEIPAIEQVNAYLAPREGLLVIDNCEHMVDAVAELVDKILETCTSLTILATSRESLEVEGEYTWKIPSLPGGEGAPAVELFFERAAAAGALLSHDHETVAVVSEIVARLDGIPLAIELAAARTRSIGIEEIRDLLDDRFSLLSGGSRRSRQRQATLEGTVQWSYDLLSDAERSMLQATSVFQGGFSLDDVATVAGVSSVQALDLVDALSAKSLIDITRDASGHVRHRLLETIRLFALARLIDAGNAVELRNRHLEHFRDDPSGSSLEMMMSVESVFRRGLEYENFRAAATWAYEQGDLAATSKIAAIVSEMSVPRGEIQIVLDAMSLEADHPDIEQVMIDTFHSWTLQVQGDPLTSEPIIARGLELGLRSESDFLVFTMASEAVRCAMIGDIERSRDLYLSARELAVSKFGPNVRALADLFWITWLVSYFEYDEAIALSEQCLQSSFNFGFLHVVEGQRVMALLLKGDIDAASTAVDSFTTVPVGSQWAHLNTLLSFMVRGHTEGTVLAGSSLASIISEVVSRRPQITSDVLVAFSYLRLLHGDQERADEIMQNDYPFALGAVETAMRLRDRRIGGSAEALVAVSQIYKDDPILAKMQRARSNTHRLLIEELTHWKDLSTAT